MNANFLSDDDLFDLTGYRLPAKQAESLAENKVHFFQRKDGKIRVTWEQVNHPGKKAANDDAGFNPDFM